MLILACLCSSWYFFLHLLCLLVVLVLPVKSRRRQAKEQQDGPQKDSPQDTQAEHNSTDNNCNQKDKATWGSGQQRAVPLAAETLGMD